MNIGLVDVDCHASAKKHGSTVYPYAQPYRDPEARNDPPQWQRDMAFWCNKRMIFNSVSFEDFEPRRGFKCKEYFNK